MKNNFNFLKDNWLSEISKISSTNPLDYYTPTYKKIIELDSSAITPILEQLEQEGDNPNPWFYALRIITHVNPVPKECIGNKKEMAKKWIEWGYATSHLTHKHALEDLRKKIQEKFPAKKRAPRKKKA